MQKSMVRRDNSCEICMATPWRKGGRGKYRHLSAEELTILCGIEPKTRQKRIPANRQTSVRAARLSKDLTAADGSFTKLGFRRALGPRERVCRLTHLRL